MDYVDAIEDGKIVRVDESYARQEGLLVLRRSSIETSENNVRKSDELVRKQESRRLKTPLDLDKFRKPLSYQKNNVVGDLKDNFHWDILRLRKAKGMTRKQLAQEIGVSEDEIKVIENGVLPKQDYVLISKIEKYLGISLRKNGMDFNKVSTPPVSVEKDAKPESVSDEMSLFGDEIEIDK